MPLMNSRISLSVLVSIFLCHLNLISQPLVNTADPFPFRNINYINSEHGLSGNDVFWITQDRRGFMWFMTETGLNRYDGSSFRSWASKNDDLNRPLVMSDYYSGLVEDKNGVLWFSNQKEGFYSFDPVYEKFSNYRNKSLGTNSLSDNTANAIAAGNNGIIWIATAVGLDKYDPVTGSFFHFVHSPGDAGSIGRGWIKGIFFDEEKSGKENQDHIWLINNDLSIELFNVSSGKVVKRFNFPFTFRWFEDLSMMVSQVSNGMIWLGSNDNGIYGFDVLAEKFIHISMKRACHSARHRDGFYHVLQDHQGNLWTVNDDNELVYFDRAIQKFYF